MEESGLYNTSINIPIDVYAGDPIDFAAAQDWATIMNTIDPNIHASALYMEYEESFGFSVPYQNPLPICMYNWVPDYPFPSDYLVPMYQENGTYASAFGYTPQIFTVAGYPNEANEDAVMNQYLAEAVNTGNVSLALSLYDKAEVLGVNLTLCVYTYQTTNFEFYSSAVHGAQYEENAIYNGGGNIIYIYLSK
jgi:hypothetical protein